MAYRWAARVPFILRPALPRVERRRRALLRCEKYRIAARVAAT